MIYIYKDSIGSVDLVDHMGNDKTIVNAARVSFGRDSKLPLSMKDAKLIRYLYKNSHTSPFEHCTITWKFVVPLFVRSQHMRHRTWSFNEISRRYTSENIRFYIPEALRTQHDNDRQSSNQDTHVHNALHHITDCVSHCMEAYNDLLYKGVCREQARMVLPQNLYTEYYGTVNLHNAIKFIGLRSSSHAQSEIVSVANAMRQDLMRLFPTAMSAMTEL